ncbi:MAG: MlaD family protein [Puniceicoccales bacterium]|jgi:paraquat-inducible protein B|nr:MlaD family protein [Puniceicoccales bacterium]
MSKPANTSLIGIFVLGGLLLLIIFIGLFGSGQFNSKKVEFICFFEDSVNGLDIGSPVKFKGVTVGKVSRVLLRIEGQTLGDNAVPVVIEIDERALSSSGIVEHFSDKKKCEDIIERGLR